MKPAIVIGGGPAGASLSVLLAEAGREVVLIEREAGPTDKVCGEFLSREAALYLTSLGLDLPALGAVPIEAVRLVTGGRAVTGLLPFAALSLSRRVLDEALLGRAAKVGATIRRGAAVEGLTRCGGGWEARLAGGATIDAGAVFLATGKHDLRGWKRPPGVQGDLVAFKLHWRLSPAQTAELARHVELIPFRGGYAGLQPVEEGRANLCLVVRRKRLSEVGRWEDLLGVIRAESPHLDQRLSGAEPCAARPLSLAAIPYGYVRRRADGVWRLGDQAAVIPSFSGDGMSIALHSGQLAAATYLDGGDADAFQRRLARDVTGQVMLATGLSLALVRRPAQRALGAAARLLPGFMAAVAKHTRVPEAALARAGLSGAA
jgi:flavin-dependent dehydrogenase